MYVIYAGLHTQVKESLCTYHDFTMVVYTIAYVHTHGDRICENVHSSHIQFFNFEDSQNLLGMIDKLETFKGYRATIPLLFWQILDLCIISSGL